MDRGWRGSRPGPVQGRSRAPGSSSARETRRGTAARGHRDVADPERSHRPLARAGTGHAERAGGLDRLVGPRAVASGPTSSRGSRAVRSRPARCTSPSSSSTCSESSSFRNFGAEPAAHQRRRPRTATAPPNRRASRSASRSWPGAAPASACPAGQRPRRRSAEGASIASHASGDPRAPPGRGTASRRRAQPGGRGSRAP